jgi:hypothetical protein
MGQHRKLGATKQILGFIYNLNLTILYLPKEQETNKNGQGLHTCMKLYRSLPMDSFSAIAI